MAFTLTATTATFAKSYGATQIRWCVGSGDQSAWTNPPTTYNISDTWNYGMILEIKPTLSNLVLSYPAANNIVGSGQGYPIRDVGLPQTARLTMKYNPTFTPTNIQIVFSNPERVQQNGIDDWHSGEYYYGAIYKFKVNPAFDPTTTSGYLGTVTAIVTMDNGEVLTTPARGLVVDLATVAVTLTKSVGQYLGATINNIQYQKNGGVWTDWTTSTLSVLKTDSIIVKANYAKKAGDWGLFGSLTSGAPYQEKQQATPFTLTSAAFVNTTNRTIEFYVESVATSGGGRV